MKMIKRQINPEVENALRNNIPVVALESTIITHGMPYPENLNMVNDVEKIIRENNAVPATIAILNGVIKIGLTKNEVKACLKRKMYLKYLAVIWLLPLHVAKLEQQPYLQQ